MKRPPSYVVPWSGKGHAYSPGDIRAVARAMRSAGTLTQGPCQSRFEEDFRGFLGVDHAFAVATCTAALELSAILSRIGPGDEVVIPAHTFAATAIPFARTGARIVWADIDPSTRVVTAKTLARCITRRTKVLVVVHLYGLVADMGPILALARRRRLLVVEDAAQALGTRYRGRRAGSMGDFGCFSFHSHKNISTLGEGGMLVVRDARLARMVPGLRHNGGRPYPSGRPRYWVPAMSDVDFDLPEVWPHNFCIGEVQCALGSRLLAQVDAINARRRRRALRIMRALRGFPELEFQRIPTGCGHSWHLLAARYNGSRTGRSRDDLMELLIRKHRVQPVVQYYPLYRYPLFSHAGFGKAACPETDRFFDSMISFPFQLWLTDRQISRMIRAIRASLEELRR